MGHYVNLALMGYTSLGHDVLSFVYTAAFDLLVLVRGFSIRIHGEILTCFFLLMISLSDFAARIIVSSLHELGNGSSSCIFCFCRIGSI